MENRLNDLNGSQWLYWTNTIYETSFPPDGTHRLRKNHGAMKPPELMAEIIRFFTKAGELVLDPFAGVGGTLLGAELADRQAIGIEINPAWYEIYQQLRLDFKKANGKLVPANLLGNGVGSNITAQMTLGDCLKTMPELEPESVAAVITDPPYGWRHGATGFKSETNFRMNSEEKGDIGNCGGYSEYLSKLKKFGAEAYRVLKPGRYLVMMIGDRFIQGEYLPLGVLVAMNMREVGFRWKGIRIWWNKATQRPLRPYAVKNCFIPNITHQNIIILRKEG
ncbi:MAG: site-specific DNA-methyltransferase [Firmicutes bacterium]|nr:site-specific DNA-methyltransferase [Bacillota bacterium]